MIEVRYTCDPCGVKRATVDARDRGPGEDLGSWMRAMALAVSLDHRQRSPDCDVDQMTSVEIPLAHGDNRAGAPTRH